MLSEVEKEAIRTQFQNTLNNLINNKIAPTGTAILNAEQPMILLFEELIYKIEEQQKEIEELKKEKFVAVDIGCIECGERTSVLGIFTDERNGKKY